MQKADSMTNMTTMSAGALAAFSAINDWSMPFFAVPLTVISVAAFCAFLSFGYGEPMKDRKNLYVTAAFITFLSVCIVAVIPPMLGWTWVAPGLRAPFAGLLAIAGRFVLPRLIELLPDILRKIFKLEKKEEGI